jgi:hypothetical protein
VRFQSRYSRHKVVIRPTYKVQIAPGQDRIERGLRAEFIGPRPAVFDSEAQAKRNGWSEADRLLVERSLLEDIDFGVRFYLAKGQTIPKEHADANISAAKQQQAAPEEQAPAEEQRVCAMVWVTEDGTQQCQRKPKKDSDFCATHAKQQAAEPANA